MLEVGRQSGEMVTGERWEAATDEELVAAPPLGHTEGGQATDGAVHRRPAAEARTETEGAGTALEVELEPLRFGVEAHRELPQQQDRGRAQDAEPEPLDIGGAGIVADPVDDRVGPDADLQRPQRRRLVDELRVVVGPELLESSRG